MAHVLINTNHRLLVSVELGVRTWERELPRKSKLEITLLMA